MSVGGPGMLGAIQKGLEALYRIDTQLEIADFLLPRECLEELRTARQPPEQLLLREHPGGLDLALYLEEGLLRTLERHDPRRGVDERNLSPLLLVLEGVSHFIYAVDRARKQRSISALELELQAEVDKYVSLVLLTWDLGERAPASLPIDLIPRLFHQVAYPPDLSAEERDRYAEANATAERYACQLERRYLRARALSGFLQDVRRFWRLSYTDKLSHIGSGA